MHRPLFRKDTSEWAYGCGYVWGRVTINTCVSGILCGVDASMGLLGHVISIVGSCDLGGLCDLNFWIMFSFIGSCDLNCWIGSLVWSKRKHLR